MFADKHDWRCNAALCKPCLFTRPELLYSPSSKIVHLASAKKLLLARNLPSRRPLYDPASPAHLSPLSFPHPLRSSASAPSPHEPAPTPATPRP